MLSLAMIASRLRAESQGGDDVLSLLTDTALIGVQECRRYGTEYAVAL